MNLEEWTCAVKIAGSKKSKYLISKIIKEQCLITQIKLYGAYQIEEMKYHSFWSDFCCPESWSRKEVLYFVEKYVILI